MKKILPSPNLEINDRGNDSLRKIKCLLSIKPEEFWVMCPEKTWKFKVKLINEKEISLEEVESNNPDKKQSFDKEEIKEYCKKQGV